MGARVRRLPSASLAAPSAYSSSDAQHATLQEQLDEYDLIRVINYVRSEVKAGRDPLSGPNRTLPSGGSPGAASSSGDASASASALASAAPWRDDRFLIPVLAEDPLLCFDLREALEQQQQQASAAAGGGAGVAAGVQQEQQQQQQQLVRRLQEEGRACREENEALREMGESPPLLDCGASGRMIDQAQSGPGVMVWRSCGCGGVWMD